MDKSYYDADFESVLKDFEKNSTLKNKGVKTDDDFDTKYKRQEVGITDKKTGKTIPPFDKATQTLKKLATASKIGKAVAIPIALGTAAYEALKDRKENKSEPATSDVEGKKKGGLVRFKKQYQMHNGKF
jgi:hypothetical protein